MAKVLKTVTDRFSLLNDGRKLGSNKRNYLIEAVRKTIESPQTQELLRLGEAFGYFGHSRRELAGKPKIAETEVVNIKGKPVVIDNVPSNRTVSISVDDEGIVTHTQEILATPTGELLMSMLDSGAGGWSWVTSGRDTSMASIVRSFFGFDFVKQPNFLSLDHPSMMMESIDGGQSMMLESLQGAGLEVDEAKAVLAKWGDTDGFEADVIASLQSEVMMLEGMVHDSHKLQGQIDTLINEEKERSKQRETMLLEAAGSSKFFINEEQANALANMSTEDDLKTVQMMFESFNRTSLGTLPLGRAKDPEFVQVKKSSASTEGMFEFGSHNRQF
ncbi:hypothetical protein [Thaumasiovibrio sp. DFM-14]|uniref:hypothetical protein n=1 Tax=Thaumasiovibrio sp. DFM-14 TaxID=3384792 RepID=UPI0039A39063